MGPNRIGHGFTALLAVVTLLGSLVLPAVRAGDSAGATDGVQAALAWAATVEVLGFSGTSLRTVNGTVLREGVVVQTSALTGATRVRIRTRDHKSWESAIAAITNPLIGLTLIQLPESPGQPASFPSDGSYLEGMRVFLLNGPGIAPDSVAARIYENFALRGFPDLCPVDAGIAGAAPAVDGTGRLLGVVCDLSQGPYKMGYIVPAGSVRLLGTSPPRPQSLVSLSDLDRPAFEDDSTATGLLFRGAVLGQSDRYDDARHFLDLAQQRDPMSPEIAFWNGRVLFAQEQFQRAAEEFQLAGSRDSTNYMSWHMAGAALNQAADYAGAEKMYLQALRVKPDAADTYCNLGGAYLNLQRAREAEAAWRNSIRINPRSQGGIAFYNLAKLLEMSGRRAAVDSVCTELSKVNPVWGQRLRDAMKEGH
jgi:tetratricopeptide (TPR) repeat protein